MPTDERADSSRGDHHELQFYYGAASGQSRAALRQLGEPDVMLNYASSGREPWDGIERLFLDSGGYSFIKGKGDYETTPAEYLDFVAEVGPELWALRDYPCEQDVLDAHDRTVREHQRMTTEAHVAVWNEADDRSDVPGQRVSVLQGRQPEDYLRHLDDLKEHGVRSDYVGIGTLCGREDVGTIRRVVTTVRDALPDRVDLHGFGVKRPALLQFREVVDALTSADSQAYNRRAQGAAYEDGRPHTWHETAFQYLRFKRRIKTINSPEADAEELREPGQAGLNEVVARGE